MAVARVTRFALQNKARASPVRPPPPARSPPCSPTPTSLLPDSLRIFLALVMCPVKSRNGNNLRAEKAEPLWRVRFGPCFIVICRGKAASDMKLEMNVVFCVLVVLTGSSQTRAQSSASPPALTLAAVPSHAGGSASPDLTEDPGNEVPQRTHNPAGRDETSAETTTGAEVRSETVTTAVHTTHMLTASSAAATSRHTTAPVLLTAAPGAPSPSAATDVLSSTPAAQTSTPPRRISTTEGRALLTRGPPPAFSSQPASTLRDTSSTAAAAAASTSTSTSTSTVQLQSQSLTTATTETTATGFPLNSSAGRGPAGPTHREVLSELNVGDEDLKGPRSSSPLDPLLAGLLSVFIVTTAIVFVILFLKFRQRTNHPEFHRLQDLPMDDLMEDTPFSRYTY